MLTPQPPDFSKHVAAFAPGSNLYAGHYPPYINARKLGPDRYAVCVRGGEKADGSYGDTAEITMTDRQFRDWICDVILRVFAP